MLYSQLIKFDQDKLVKEIMKGLGATTDDVIITLIEVNPLISESQNNNGKFWIHPVDMAKFLHRLANRF